MIKPKLNANSKNDTITAKSPGRLGELFIEIARKHNLDEKEAHQMLYELLSALAEGLGTHGTAKEPAFIARRSFDEILEYVQQAFSDLVAHLPDGGYPAHLHIFNLEVDALTNNISDQPENRRHLAILLSKVAHHWRKSAKSPTEKQIEAAKNLITHLSQSLSSSEAKEEPTFDDVMDCADRLEEAGIRTTIQSGALAELLTEWTDEGFAGVGDGNDIP